MNDSYLTLEKEAHDEITIQKSRFIGYALPCSTEDEAVAFIKTIREKHRDARHHCYAYMIGLNRGISRYSDDGEPGGTAGLPILDVLKNAQLVNCCVVVVRYFGGVLLGTGGLVRAYTQGCRIAVQAAKVIRMEKSVLLRCSASYPVWNQFQYALQKKCYIIRNIEYTDRVSFTICLRAIHVDECIRMLNDLSDGNFTWEESANEYIPWPVDTEGANP